MLQRQASGSHQTVWIPVSSDLVCYLYTRMTRSCVFLAFFQSSLELRYEEIHVGRIILRWSKLSITIDGLDQKIKTNSHRLRDSTSTTYGHPSINDS